MPELKLAKLPERTPIKITINVPPEMYADLGRYAAMYREAYGQEEAITELIPAMLGSFLEGDRELARRKRTATSGT